MNTPPGKVRFGAYWLLKRLAKGGMAEIYLASPAQPGREHERLVIKRLLPQFSEEEEFLRMFLQEARLASQLAHPNIVRILDLGLEGGHLYLAMEFIDGQDLESLTRGRRRWLSPALAARIAIEVCAALAFAHQATDLEGQPLRVVHRDVTPENVMISRTGEVKLVDFGVAKATAKLSMTRPGVVKGKISYMAPEHILGHDLDGRADLFSLGATLYELTTGIKPFERGSLTDSMAAILRTTPDSPTEVAKDYPPALAAIIMKALQKEPHRRFSSAKEMKAELERYLDSTERIFSPSDLAAFVEGVPVDAESTESVPLSKLNPVSSASPRDASDYAVAIPVEPDPDPDSGPPTMPAGPAVQAMLATDPSTDTQPPRAPPPPRKPLRRLVLDPRQREPTVEYDLPGKDPPPSSDDFAPADLGGDGDEETSTAVSKLREKAPRSLAARVAGAVLKGTVLGAMLLGAAWVGRVSALRDMNAKLAALRAEQAAALQAVAEPDGGEARALFEPGDGGRAAESLDGAVAAADAALGPSRDGGAAPDAAARSDAGARAGMGTLVVEGRGPFFIDDKPCRTPCAAKLPAGEHVVRLGGKRKAEKKVAIEPGEKQTIRLP